MYRSTRNTIASYTLFIYGCLLMLLCIVSLESDPTKLSFLISMIMGIAVAFMAAIFSNSYSLGMHFWTRNIVAFILLTLSEILIWYLVCEGAFKLKLDSFS